MNWLGWIVMTISISSVLALTLFCLYRVFKLPPVEIENLDIAPLEIDTRDSADAD